MRKIEGSIYSHLNFTNPEQSTKIDVAQYDPFVIRTFEELVEKIAFLSFYNMDHLLFFRGQRKDHLNANKNSSFFPSIYRTANDEILQPHILSDRFRLLEQASELLVNNFKEQRIESGKELQRRKFIQWSILQHYEVCDTPLLDMTQSIRVACSFALSKDANEGFIFVFGLPYITNRISINSEQDIVNIRLINICPPQALRPYFQEGFLVGTADITTDYEIKTELDFKRRLIAKFKIHNTREFWGKQQSLDEYLKPKNDQIEILCDSIKSNLSEQNNIQAMFPGTWMNNYVFEDGRKGSELVVIRNGNEYHALGKHLFNLDSILIDKKNGVIKFRKTGVGSDKRRAFNTLQIINKDKYEGIETPRTKIEYKRID